VHVQNGQVREGTAECRDVVVHQVAITPQALISVRGIVNIDRDSEVARTVFEVLETIRRT
jgi:hypothetical protein